MKILLLRARGRDVPFGFDHYHSFRAVPSRRRRFPLEPFRFAALHWPRNLLADCTLVSSAPALHTTMPPALPWEVLHSKKGGLMRRTCDRFHFCRRRISGREK